VVREFSRRVTISTDRLLSANKVPAVFDDPQQLARFFASANAVISPLLQSPLHRTISGRLMLLGYTGGKTGKRYSFAVGYFPWHDGEVLVSSSANWAKTIGNARDVQLLIKGRSFAAKPKVIKDAEQKADVLGEFARRNGAKAAKGLMLGLPGDRAPTRAELLAAAQRTTLVRFSLSGTID
jgi:hypothetical protein